MGDAGGERQHRGAPALACQRGLAVEPLALALTTAHCLAHGPLQGRRVRLVEHGSLRWPSRDNARIDALHAYAVRDYLIFHGVKRDAIEVVAEHMPVTGVSSADEPPHEPRVDVQLLP